MSKEEIYNFIQKHELGVLATVSSLNAPEAALVGFAVTPNLELVFDTLGQTRKCQNLRLNPKIAFVIGWDAEITLSMKERLKSQKATSLNATRKSTLKHGRTG